MVSKVGVIGLGAMGLQMARHMAGKGLLVSGFDIDAKATQNARDIGVAIGDGPAQVA